ncbi:MAG TPA: hypothetical protein PK367_00495 [Candidatus Paceibacterota bacterium]|nr:hypothetical protein [Candidatus Paceibacterota bacterium]
MDDKIYFIGLIILGGIGIIMGLSVISGAGFSNPFASGSEGLFASAFAAVETSWVSSVGQFLITFDDFKNSHQEILDEKTSLKVFDVDGFLQKNVMWVATDNGLFLSRDGGLTWNRFVSSNNEIDADTMVFKVIPASSNGEDFFISVFNGNVGTVYRTYDYFFHLEKLMDFDNEGAYDIYRQGNYLYFGMSTGQIIRYNLSTRESKVINVLTSPVLKIDYSKDGNFYLLLRNGSLMKGATLASKFEKVKIPGDWFFGSSPIKNVVFDNGVIYILTKDGVFVSYDSGIKFELLKHIPILKKKVDVLGVNNGAIYVVSDKKMYISHDGGDEWSIIYLSNEFKASSIYFVKNRIIVSM